MYNIRCIDLYLIKAVSAAEPEAFYEKFWIVSGFALLLGI